ncbi:MAG: hypothetical protein H0Z34_10970 [Brevibacillus sp.]|nr:hypothetical protein [Brevibacillus sp.]
MIPNDMLVISKGKEKLKVSNEWQAMTNEMKLAFEPVGNAVLDVAKPIVSFIADMTRGIGEFAQEHPLITK